MTAAVMTQSVFTQTEGTFRDFEDQMFQDTRVYLECPYNERELVKKLGCRFDFTQRRWYAPPGTNLEPLAPWRKQRIYLRCGDANDQDVIETLGAKYDTTVCGYYILDNMDKVPFQRWLP